MEFIWAGASVLLLAAVCVLAIRLSRYRKQICHMLEELELLEGTQTNRLLTSLSNIGRTQEVVLQVNRVLEQSRRSKEQLVRANRSYRESIASISHDIRTPLTSAKGYIQMLQDLDIPQEKRMGYAKVVERRLDDLTGMLDQLFLYARIEAGELVLHRERIHAGNLFAETVSLFYGDFTERGFEPKVSLEPKPCYIDADRQAFIRILENLIKNALVHGTGGYELSLRSNGETVAVQVSNQTDSIGPEDVDRIFERFYTTDISRGRKMTGLGLAIVKGLAGQMDGEAKAWLEGGVFSIAVYFPASCQ